MDKEIENCISFLREKYALDISMYDSSFLENTIKGRMTASSCGSVGTYLQFLGQYPGEQLTFLNQLSNSYSEFFRNPITFAYLEQIVLPSILARKIKNQEKEIRIWSAACASGQEAYSLAILCYELIDNVKSDISVRIFATDRSNNELRNALKGDYQLASLNKVTLNRVQKYFTQQGDNFSISPQLKELVNFSVFDLLSDNGTSPPASIYGNFDLVFCTNLLFYYKPEFQQKILGKCKRCLASGGYIITGESEREIGMRNNLREVFVNSGIFLKR